MADPQQQPQFAHRYDTTVRVRWSDMDAFGHLNHARALTLLEEARLDWLVDEAVRDRAADITKGMVVTRLDAQYLRPIRFADPVTVSIGVTAVTAGSVTVDYRVLVADRLMLTASTQLVPVDPSSFRPRRWSPGERSFLRDYLAG